MQMLGTVAKQAHASRELTRSCRTLPCCTVWRAQMIQLQFYHGKAKSDNPLWSSCGREDIQVHLWLEGGGVWYTLTRRGFSMGGLLAAAALGFVWPAGGGGAGVVLSLCWLLPAAALGFAEHCSQTLPQNTAHCFTHIFYPSPAAHQDCQLLTGWHISRVACCCHGPHRPRRSSSLADRRPHGCCRSGYGGESCLRGL